MSESVGRPWMNFGLKQYSLTGTSRFQQCYFLNAEGDLIDFRSEDRYEVGRMERLPFTTPVKDYREFEGIRVPSYGEAIWHYSDGPFVYGKFKLKELRYNLAEIPPGEDSYVPYGVSSRQ